MKIIEYKTATGSDIPSLDMAVNKLINEGFEPYGQQYFATSEKPEQGFVQPMIRKENLSS
jgi:hypothetical protein